MFVKGTGWCTMDALMDFSREKYDRLLSIAKSQHIHIDDIVQIVREEFGEGNDFCRKITYSAQNPEALNFV